MTVSYNQTEMIYTYEITADETTWARLMLAAKGIGVDLQSLVRPLPYKMSKRAIAQMEREHAAGYIKQPVVAGEFDVPDEDLWWEEQFSLTKN